MRKKNLLKTLHLAARNFHLNHDKGPAQAGLDHADKKACEYLRHY